MLRWLVGSSLRLPLLVALAAGTVMALGVTQLPQSRVDVLPEVAPPYVQIQTEALGLSAVEVEQLVTAPMEQQLLNGVAFLDEIRSRSVPGMSSIELVFEPGTDLLEARQLVQERLTMAHDLPNVSKAPVMIQPLSSTSRLMIIGLRSDELSLIEMSVLARWKIRPRLMGVPGVANVAIWGQREQQLQVRADPRRLNRNGVTLDQLIRTTANALWVSPLTFVEASTPGSGGFIDTPNQRLDIQHILPIRTPADLAQVSVEGGAGLSIGDVAEVVEDHQPMIGDALVRDGPSLMLVVEKFPGTNTLQVTRDVEDALAALRVGLPGLETDTSVFRPATFIETASGNIGTALLVGVALVVAALMLLFLSWRAALVSLLAMTVSLAGAVLVLQIRGGVFNTAILAGLVIALAAVVDDAVLDVDQVLRRLRRSPAGADTPRLREVILESCLATRGSLMFGALIAGLAAAPLLALGGVTGALVSPLVVTYLLAIATSFLVALTVTPALTSLLLAWPPVEQRDEPPVTRWLGRHYRAVLPRLVHRPAAEVAAAGVLVAVGLVAVAALPGAGTQPVLPSVQDRHLLIDWEAAPGTSHPEMNRVTARVTEELRRLPGVRNVGAHVGRAITGDQVVGVNSGEIWVTLEPQASYDESAAAVREVVAGYPGLSHDLTTYPDDVLDQRRSAAEGALIARVYGTDLAVLRAKAEEVRQSLQDVAGVVGARVEAGVQEPTVEIEVDLEAAERFGLKPGDVRRAAATVVSGIEVGNLFEAQKVFEVVVWGSEGSRHSLRDVHELMIDLPDGRQVRLDRVADVRVVPNLTVIEHDAVSRYVDVVADVAGEDIGSVVEAVGERVKAIEFPLEHHVEVLQGSSGAASGASADLLGLGLAGAVLVLLLLQAAFDSWRLAALVFVLLPTSVVGGVLALYVGGAASLGALAGLLTVLGLTARQSILLVRQYQHLEGSARVTPAQAIVIGSTDRLMPVVLTNLSIAVFLLPFAFVAGIPGHELLHPLALVIIGGLVTSTLVTLFALPALYAFVRSGSRLGDRNLSVRTGPAPGVK
jgi:Cu/Ag efflux pump CusA